MIELFSGALARDARDFEYENSIETTLVDIDDHTNLEALDSLINCIGVWILSLQDVSIQINLNEKSILFNKNNFYSSSDRLFDELHRAGNQWILILKK
jgi:hypothetical protein